MTLLELEVLPNGEEGWTSGPWAFGERTTLLLGPNGSGKTPLIKLLSSCLGQPVELPPDVVSRCAAARLTVRSEGQKVVVTRQLTSEPQVSVEFPGEEPREIADDRELSALMLKLIGVSERKFVGLRGELVPPYISVLAPVFIVDQDQGWTVPYARHERHNFVRDQREEMVRWVLDLPGRHAPVDRGEYQSVKLHLASLQEQIGIKRRTVEALLEGTSEATLPDTVERLVLRRSALQELLSVEYLALTPARAVDDVVTADAAKLMQERSALALQLEGMERRLARFATTQRATEAELAVLADNEIAADAFRHFCGNENCQFFRKPEESYGRRLLYLKDQLKDFQTGLSTAQKETGLLRSRLKDVEERIAALQQAAISIQRERPEDGLARRIKQYATELADVNARLRDLERIEEERKQLEALVLREEAANVRLSELRPRGAGGRDRERLLDARARLALALSEWMEVLRTPNVSRDVTIDENLRILLGGERFANQSHHSGSTRTRIVLAYHAALLETSLALGGHHPRLLLLDAPRQHELAARDLQEFTRRFCERFGSGPAPVQLVITATDRDVVPPDCLDQMWEPPFVSEGVRHFFGRSEGA